MTLDEAIAWYRYGGGDTIYVDGSRLEYTVIGVNPNGKYSAIVTSSINDFLVYGHVTVNPVNGRIYYDTYDFDYHPSSPIRNYETLIGSGLAGHGNDYTIGIDYTGKWRSQ